VVDVEGNNVCWGLIEIVDDAQPVRTAVVEEDGIFRLPLLPGSYTLTATDPIDGCPVRWPVEVTDRAFVRYDFIFDHGAY
jgi:hypothetical protein